MDKQVQQIVKLLIQTMPEDLPANLEPIYHRRLEILVRTHLGQSQTEICSALNCSKDTARHWMTIANTEELSHWHEQPVGRPKRVDENYLQRLRELVTSSPKEHGYAFERWTALWLSKHLAKELGIEVSDRHVNRLLKQMGLSTRSSGKSQAEKSVVKGHSIVIDDIDPTAIRRLQELCTSNMLM